MTGAGASTSRPLTYAGIFLVALSTLMLEILLARITSVVAWYHLAFFVISLAMLGMTAGAVIVFLLPKLFTDDRIPERLAQSALLFAATTPIALALAMAIPLLPIDELMDFSALLVYGGALAIPFALGGVTLTLALTRAGLPASIAYGVDLCGAAIGCALVIPLLDLLDAPSAALIAAAVGAGGALCFGLARGPIGRRQVARAATLAAVLIALGFANAGAETPPLRPAWVKAKLEDPARYEWIGWNTYSRVTVGQTVDDEPEMWSGSRLLPAELAVPTRQRTIKIDGAAATTMYEHADELERHAHIDWDITSFAHQLRPEGAAAIIGVGGGRDVIVAARAGHSPVVGIELNDLIVELHTEVMVDYSRLTRIPGVELIADEARSYMAREQRSFSVITMSLIDTWASTGAGSYSLSENGLYTVEAWEVFVDRLDDDGIYTVSRWYHPSSPGETARMLAIALELLWRRGVDDPHQHLIVLQNFEVATLLLSPTPFAKHDLDAMQEAAVEMGFTMLATPRRGPLHGGLLAQLWAIDNQADLWAWTRAQELDLTPPTDDRPFFFNTLKPQTWLANPETADDLDVAFLGNLQATQTLVYATLVSLLLTLVTIVAPLFARRGELRSVPRKHLIAATLYFALIGLGFMFVEIGLLSRLNVFLGHPTIALAVLLGGIILFAGLGSVASSKLPVERNRKLAQLYPLLPFALVLLAVSASGPLTQAFAASEMSVRVLVGIATVAVPALGMGLGFPLGLRLVQRRREHDGGPELGPWLWGINGAAGVCASGLALGCSMVWGVPVTLGVGAACYLLLLACTRRLGR